MEQKSKKRLKERFEQFDKTAEYNQLKVLMAMQKNKVSAECFQSSAATDIMILDEIRWKKFMQILFIRRHALVRPQITCGTHALALALSGNLRPGDELLSPAGKPYDTLGRSNRYPSVQRISGRIW